MKRVVGAMSFGLISLHIKVQFFKKNYLNYFNWRIITLQYCDDLCHIST